MRDNEIEVYRIEQFYENNLTDEKVQDLINSDRDWKSAELLGFLSEIPENNRPAWGSAWYKRVAPNEYVLWKQNWDSSG